MTPYVPLEIVSERLPLIFPEGTPNRNYCIRDLAAKTVFAALYVGAIEGTDRYLGPVHVYRMTDEQAQKSQDAERTKYATEVVKKGASISGKRWYADNSREPIRDETLRDGLVAIGAVVQRKDVATTSGLPRYALVHAFAELFDPELSNSGLTDKIEHFQQNHLSKSALARVTIMRAGASANDEKILVTFPSGETRHLAPGPSSFISKGVIEVFAARFLEQPAVLWLSESGNKVVMRDDSIASAIGLKIEADKNLPDLILVDLGPKDPMLVFVEVVATDGAITPRRKDAVYQITDSAGFQRSQVTFLTAYQDRQSAGFKKTVSQLAWGSFAWFVSEPENIISLIDGSQLKQRLPALVQQQ